jgi:hypothetical protein
MNEHPLTPHEIEMRFDEAFDRALMEAADRLMRPIKVKGQPRGLVRSGTDVERCDSVVGEIGSRGAPDLRRGDVRG